MHVVALWCYPVKSMLGEQLDHAWAGERGLEGDRRWALRDEATGMMLTARRQPELLFAHSRIDGSGQPEIIRDDGSVLRGDDELSRWLGHPVRLVSAEPESRGSFEVAIDDEAADRQWVSWEGPAGSFHDTDGAQVSILSQSRIGVWDPRRFRANLLVDQGDEQDLLGATVTVGSMTGTVAVPIDRCVMTTRPQAGGIQRDLDVLRTINRERRGRLAVGLTVTAPGTISVGDEVIVRR